MKLVTCVFRVHEVFMKFFLHFHRNDENDIVTKRFRAVHVLRVGNKPGTVHGQVGITSWNY